MGFYIPVHGTWISGKKIEPGVMVELKEGDTMQLGGSRRLYRLHWLPVARAYDLDNPFVLPLDTLDEVNETHRGIYQVNFKKSTCKNIIILIAL